MGRLTGSSIYLDTNALIHFVEGENGALRHSLEIAFAQGAQILTSELTLAKVLVAPLREGDPETVDAYEMMFSRGDLLRCISVDREVWRRSAKLRAELGGKLPDTVHAATALLTGCAAIVSSDKRLRVPKDLRVVSIDHIGSLENIL